MPVDCNGYKTLAEQLQVERDRLREILVECAKAVGASVSPGSSLGFLAGIPAEIEAVLERRSKAVFPEGYDGELWQVALTEYDRMRTPEVFSRRCYTSAALAKEQVEVVNSKNNKAEVPDCYVKALMDRVQ